MALAWTYKASPAWAVGTPTLPYTFTADIGSAAADRFVVVSVAWIGNGHPQSDLAYVKINNVTATLVGGGYTATSNRYNAIYWANVPLGSGTQNIEVTANNGTGWINLLGINVGIFAGDASVTAGTPVTSVQYPNGYTGSNTASVTCPVGGFVIFSGYAEISAIPAITWTNTDNSTSDADNYDAANGVMVTIQHSTSSASVTETVIHMPGGSGWIAVPFSPGAAAAAAISIQMDTNLSVQRRMIGY